MAAILIQALKFNITEQEKIEQAKFKHSITMLYDQTILDVKLLSTA